MLMFTQLFLTLFLTVAVLSFGCSNVPQEERESGQERNSVEGPRTDTPPARVIREPETARSAVGGTNAVCPDPKEPCHHKEKRFDDWELSFRMPSKLSANRTYSSAPFYAVILETYEFPDCDGGEVSLDIEKKRKEVQRLYPQRKVFASYECPNMAGVIYEFDGKWDEKRVELVVGDFLAIYAGESRDDALSLLNELQPQFPGAVVKQMAATFARIVQ